MEELKKLEEKLHISKREYEYLFNTNGNPETDTQPSDLELEEEKLAELKSIVDEIREYSESHNIYCVFSSASAYENLYPSRLEEFLNGFPDSKEAHFINEELKKLPELSSIYYLRKFKFSNEEKREFLENKLIKITHDLENGTAILPNYLLVYLLNEIGIIDFMINQKGYSDSKIAKVLSKITGKAEKGLRIKIGISERLKDKLKYKPKTLAEICKIDDFIRDEKL